MMKIDFTVTNRDKKLLAGLAVFAAVLGFYRFGVCPVTESIKQLEAEKEQLELDALQMQVNIAALSVDEKHNEEQKEQISELEEEFFDYQTNEEINRYLTGVFVEEGMTLQDSTLRAGQLDEITPYSLSGRMKLVKANEKSASDTDEQTKQGAWTQTDSVYSAQADYCAIGTKKQALAVLDRLAQKEGIRIVSFSISDAAVRTEEEGSQTLRAGKRLEVSMMIYMVRGGSDGK